MPNPVVAIAGSSIVGGIMGSNAAKSSAKTIAGSTKYAADLQDKAKQQAREDLAAYRGMGYQALTEIGGGMAGRQPMYDEQGNIVGYQTGTGYLTGQLTPDQIASYLDPSMAFRMKYGTQATERLANVGQGALSGNTLRGLQEFGQNLASTEYGNAFNRAQTERANIYNTLANIAGMGQGAVNTGVQASQNAAQNITGLITGAGAAQAAGQVGSANAWSNALQGPSNYLQLSALMGKNPFGGFGSTTPGSMGAPTSAGTPYTGTFA